jgi:tRNA(Ile)-lysidine synthase
MRDCRDSTIGSVTDRVLNFATRHAMFGVGQRVGVAVSGGADSVCLLHVMLALRERLGISLVVLHVDHQLRGDESRGDADFVKHLALRSGLIFHIERVNVGSNEGNLEENARHARLAFFTRLRREGVVDRIATGHTQSDQAETVLFRFLRGSGTTGLAGILPVTAEGIVRPLLAVKRSEVEYYLREKEIAWREDSSNRSERFTRNRIRHELIPLLERQFQPALVDQLANLAELSRDEDRFLDQLCEQQLSARAPGTEPVLACSKLANLPVALARRVVRRALREVKGDLRQIDFSHVEAVMAMVRGGGSPRRIQLPGVDVRRSFDWVRFAAAGVEQNQGRTSMPIPLPGEVELPDGHRVRVRSVGPERGYNSDEAGRAETGRDCLDWDRIEGPLTVRYWLPGDTYCPEGARQPEKLKQMFQIARIPLWERRFWPIIETSQGIVWSRRFGSSTTHKATPNSHRVLKVEEIPAD